MPKQNSMTEENLWIAIRINDTFLIINDDPYDVYVLMNAITASVFGHILAKADSSPFESDVESLFEKAYKKREKWPNQLIIPDSSKARDVFKAVAKKHNIMLKTMPLSSLSPIIQPFTEAFAQEEEDDY